jgi:hypothetical protein
MKRTWNFQFELKRTVFTGQLLTLPSAS